MTTDLKWVFDIIQSYKEDLRQGLPEGLVRQDEYENKTEVLDQLAQSLKEFIKEANKL